MKPTARISEYADIVLAPHHDSADAVLATLADPYRYAHCLDFAAESADSVAELREHSRDLRDWGGVK